METRSCTIIDLEELVGIVFFVGGRVVYRNASGKERESTYRLVLTLMLLLSVFDFYFKYGE